MDFSVTVYPRIEKTKLAKKSLNPVSWKFSIIQIIFHDFLNALQFSSIFIVLPISISTKNHFFTTWINFYNKLTCEVEMWNTPIPSPLIMRSTGKMIWLFLDGAFLAFLDRSGLVLEYIYWYIVFLFQGHRTYV